MKQTFGTGFAVTAATTHSPAAAVLTAAGVPISLWVASLVLPALADGRVAPLLSTVIGTAAFAMQAVISHVVTSRREASARSRFEQHLAPAVVRRVLETPGSRKLRSEQRDVTALFTNLEGFTAMTHRADPEILVATLDTYFEGMAHIIVAYGGTIDKIVGDGVHALFNAPNDLEDHPERAIECAIALRSWAELFRRRPEVASIGFGRTRIGIETGPAIVGDVGIHAKLDYTAHGDAINAAARLEHANKELGSSICIGPVAASRCDQSLLRPLGKITIRGRDDAVEVFEPWSSEASYAHGRYDGLPLRDTSRGRRPPPPPSKALLLRQHHDVQAILRHIDTAEREHSHLRIPCLLMRARAQATVRVRKKRPELQAHSRFAIQDGCGLPVATGAVS